MQTGLEVIEGTDWSKLLHAYGSALDTPAHLYALVAEDSDARKSAMQHLWSAIIHQGTPWTATEPVARVVAGIIFDSRVRTIRSALLSFLITVAEAPKQAGLSVEELDRMASYDISELVASGDDDALYQDEDASNSFYAQSILGCIRVSALISGIMLNGLGDPDHKVRMYAAMGASMLQKEGVITDQQADLPTAFLFSASTAENPIERCAFVLALGEIGEVPTRFLSDPSPQVRMCAALAPKLAKDPNAIRILVDILINHVAQFDDWFAECPPQFEMRPRFYVVKHLVKSVRDFESLANAAIAVVNVTTSTVVDYDWGPLLAAAFPDGDGLVKTDAQRRFLTALTNRNEIWLVAIGNAHKWFKQAGLPNDRAQCIALLKPNAR